MSATRDQDPPENVEEQERIHTEERMAMDTRDMADAIDQEQDQKVKPGDESRYEDDVDDAMGDDAH